MADKKATAAQIDFTNVKDQALFNKKHQPAGDYKARITKVVDATKKDDKSVKMWLFTIDVNRGQYPYYCNRMAENQLWKIRNLIQAAGMNVPKKKLNVDPNKLVGKYIGVALDDEEYEGKMQSVVASTFPLSELETEEDEEESEDEEDEEPEEEDEEDVEEEIEEEPPKKKAKAASQGGKKKKKSKPKMVDEVSDEELEELEIEDI